MTRADHTHLIKEARHYRLIGWRDLAAMYLGLAALCRQGLAQLQQKEAA